MTIHVWLPGDETPSECRREFASWKSFNPAPFLSYLRIGGAGDNSEQTRFVPRRVDNGAVGWLHFRRATPRGREERVGDGGGWFADYCTEQVIILSATAIDLERWQESTTE